MNIASNRSWALAALASAVALSACASEPEDRAHAGEARIGEARGAESVAPHASALLRWGSNPSEVGFHPKAHEIGAEGPSSIAVRRASIFVLDRLNDRVTEVQLGRDGAAKPVVRVAASVSRDAEHLAVGASGSLAAWSPLRASVRLYARDGEPAGEIAVPRVLRDIRSIHLDASSRVRVTTSLQESFDLGSPSAPLDLSSTLRTKREGAAFLADGRGVAVRASGGAAELLVYAAQDAPSRSEKIAVAARHRIEGPLDAAEIVGTVGSIVCMRLDRVSTPQAAIVVTREAICTNAITGATILRALLPAPGSYTPHEELAVGDDPPSLAAMTPQEDGLLVQRWSLRAEVSR